MQLRDSSRLPTYARNKIIDQQKKNKPLKPGQQHFFKKYGNSAKSILPSGYHVEAKLGEGAYGTAYLICKEYVRPVERRPDLRRGARLDASCMVMKVQKAKYPRMIKKEIDMHSDFYKAGLAPKLMGTDEFKIGRQKYVVIFMEKIDGILESTVTNFAAYEPSDVTDNLCNQIMVGVKSIFTQLKKYKLYHADAHAGNIGWVYEMDNYGRTQLKFTFIDFGWASNGGSNIKLELVQLIRGLMISQPDFKNKQLYKCLMTNLYKYFNQLFPSDNMRLTWSAVDRKFNADHDRYQVNVYYPQLDKY